ncbi:MAG: AAA family ATPase [Chromatiaceae bacterium]|nr:AAA family ATPase [Chromatiaceae bacterium]MBP6733152.1 AAA family ATPase [Chromatiaceae bacterium]MBP6806722.1 AAA family ATPase [Chromatiaceae bacterium]MBP8288353.1 AAA family ATPase [Chromatiaceae bacterium]MBP9602521.1 AAA family ATPase [Chromatiaceae bacterium]
MRFKRLYIPAFGPFTHLDLSFPAEDSDLHVIYGENEAGKSSLLRAIRDLLFGIHGQSPDNFLHDYKNLLVLGEIENRAGEQLVFQRRKGNKNTLLDRDGNPLPDNALRPFLGGIDQAYFSAMFGLGGRELREGAVQLLKGEGEIGNALFSASLGGTPIQRVLEALIATSEQLFKGRATANVSIRPAVNRHKDLLKQSRDATVNADTWDQLERDLTQRAEARKHLEDEINEIAREITWVDRCEDALPTVGRLSDEIRSLSELPPLPDVASDFVERARLVRSTVASSSDRVQALTTKITQLESQLAGCATFPEILADAEALDLLHQELGAYREQKKMLAKLEVELAGIEPMLRAGMKSLGVHGELESLGTLRLSSAVQLSCEEAARTLQDAMKHHSENAAMLEALQVEIANDVIELTLLPETDLTPLREALAKAAEATEANKTLAASQAEVENLIRTVATEQALVPGIPENVDAAARLAVPSPATIRKFREQFDRLEREIDQADKLIRDEERKIKALEDELRRLERRGALPSEESLGQARGHRDHGWHLVLAEWKGGGAKEQLDPDSPLEEAFPQAIIKADNIADQLRHDAEAVAQAEEKRLQIRGSQEAIIEVKVALAACQDAVVKCQAAWEAEWAPSGISPRSPDEMEDWRENWVRFRDTASKLREAEAAFHAKGTKVQIARDTLTAVLTESPNKSFSVLFETARSRVQQGEESTGQRNAIEKRLDKQKRTLTGLDRKSADLLGEVEKAKVNWKLRCRTADLMEDTTPESGLKLLQERKDLIAKFDTWGKLSGDAGIIAGTIRRYELSVAEKAVALEIEAGLTEAQEVGLWKALSQARNAQAEHDQLVIKISDAKTELMTARQAETKALEDREGLMRLSNLEMAEELEPLLANLERRKTLRDRIDGLREALSAPARGQGLDEFIALVQAENADDLPQRKSILETRKAEKTLIMQDVHAELIKLNREKDDLDRAGDAAADFRQQAESVVATLKQDAARFIRLRLAADFLRNQIERFRKENQGPLLEKSGQVFKQMTRGAFDGLAAEFNIEDVPVMVGTRMDGATVPVEGMSDGSRDQLYLALRLAATDRYLEEHEPMPLILDDLLITFDNERTGAILPQLANLAKRTQIFLFTHHEHLVELCRGTVGEGQFKLHQLSSSVITRAEISPP